MVSLSLKLSLSSLSSLLLPLILPLILLFTCSVSIPEYNILQFDRTTPTYSPSGALHQLSYTLPPSQSRVVIATRPTFKVVARSSPSPSNMTSVGVFKLNSRSLLVASGYAPDAIKAFDETVGVSQREEEKLMPVEKLRDSNLR